MKLGIRTLPGVSIGHYMDAEMVSRKGIEHLKANPESPFFLYMHYMDPHEPYFKRPYTGEHLRPPLAVKDKSTPSEELIADFVEYYTDEVEYLDQHLGTLFNYLKESGQYENTIIVITNDHGEEFYDHENWGHGNTVFNELISAALIIKFPNGEKKGTVDSTLYHSVDFAPTLVNYVGGEIPPNWFGRDIFNELQVDYIISIAGYKAGIAFCNGKEKLYIKYSKDDETAVRNMYFDLISDPLEKNDLADIAKYQERRALLYDSLNVVESELAAGAVTAGKTELDESTKEQLKALGYME